MILKKSIVIYYRWKRQIKELTEINVLEGKVIKGEINVPREEHLEEEVIKGEIIVLREEDLEEVIKEEKE